MSIDRNARGSVETCIENLTDFSRPLAERLCRIIRRTAPHLEEGIRWGSPTWKGRDLVCGIGAFQKHVALILWRGAEVPDPKGLLVHGQGRSAMRSAKFTELKQLDEKMITAWIAAAVALDHAEKPPRPKREPKPEAEVPAVLERALKKNTAARNAFKAMPPSHRREYCEWIADAKQEATVERRVAKAIEKLAAGEGLNDKYRR